MIGMTAAPRSAATRWPKGTKDRESGTGAGALAA